MKKRINLRLNQGFTLLELLLAITIMAALFTGAATIFNDWAKASVDRQVSREMQRLQNAASEYVRLNLNNLIDDSIPNVGDTDEIDLADLIADGFLPNGYNGVNSYKQTLRVFVRHADDDSLNGNVIEVLSFSEGPRVSNSRLINAASNGDKSVGVISDINISATCCNGNIQSLSGSWSVPIANYTGLTTVTAPNPDGGFIAAYNVVSVNEDIANSYLYRPKMRNIPQLNRMDTNLNLNGNDIVNAAIVVADSMTVQGNVNLAGQLRDGSPAPYVLAVAENLNANQNVIVNSGGLDTKGNVIINGDDGAGNDFIVNNLLEMRSADNGLGNISASTVITDNLTASGTSEFGDVSAENQSVEASAVLNRLTRYNDQIEVNNLQAANTVFAGEIRAGSATIAETTITNSNGFILNNNQPLNIVRTVDVFGDVTISELRGTSEVNIRNMLSCTSGCP